LVHVKPCVENEIQAIYVEALHVLRDHNVPFLLGGAFAVWFYTGVWRHTHDMDVFTEPQYVPAAAEALLSAGFEDLGEQAPGDREWIYHAIKGDIIVDVIFKFANRITAVGPEWIRRAKPGELLGEDVLFLPAEELVWSKIFTMNKHRCDWPDVMRIIRANCANFDWNHLLEMLGDHWLLLAGLTYVFDWQHPSDYQCIPQSVRDGLLKRREEYRPQPGVGNREKLLDPWIHSRPEDKCYWEQ
jgi:hypothetical protein